MLNLTKCPSNSTVAQTTSTTDNHPEDGQASTIENPLDDATIDKAR